MILGYFPDKEHRPVQRSYLVQLLNIDVILGVDKLTDSGEINDTGCGCLVCTACAMCL